MRELPGSSIDPSLPLAEQTRTARTSKIVIDATRYDMAHFPPVCQPAAAALDKVEREWARYEIPLGPARGGQR
jgi:hypothetical protein